MKFTNVISSVCSAGFKSVVLGVCVLYIGGVTSNVIDKQCSIQHTEEKANTCPCVCVCVCVCMWGGGGGRGWVCVGEWLGVCVLYIGV